MNLNFFPKERPYWHVDAKWVSGILFMASLMAALLLNTMATLTNPKNGVEFSATLIASVFSREGLDEAGDLDKVRAEVEASATGEYVPLPNFPNVKVTKEDVLTLSPRELRLKIFRQVAEPIYTKGIEGAAAEITDDPQQIEKFKRDAFLLAAFTQQTHNLIAGWARTLAIIAVLAVLAVIFFSWGWGRLANPGVLMLAVSLPGAFIGFLLKNAPPGKDNGGPLSIIPPDVMPDIASAMSATYGPLAIVGALALAAAGIGRMLTKRQKSGKA